jgi:phosphoserine phosphatase
MGTLHLFDMDGTLLLGTTASLQVARALGRVGDLVELETRFAAGDLDAPGFAVAVHAMWWDLTPGVVTTAFAVSPWLRGIEEVCSDIRRRGERSAVITLSPDFFATLLLDLGFDEVVASRFPPLPFAGPIDPAGILGPSDKVEVLERLRTSHRIPKARCVAYGDSMSDAPLFRHLDATVAVNADHHLAGLAAATYRGDDLTAAYALGRALVTTEGRMVQEAREESAI